MMENLFKLKCILCCVCMVLFPIKTYEAVVNRCWTGNYTYFIKDNSLILSLIMTNCQFNSTENIQCIVFKPYFYSKNINNFKF